MGTFGLKGYPALAARIKSQKALGRKTVLVKIGIAFLVLALVLVTIINIVIGNTTLSRLRKTI